MSDRKPIPRFESDYSDDAAEQRRQFLHSQTGADLSHIGRFSMPAESVAGNIENFIGALQMPLGVAGPCLIHGEHADGWFYIPMATTEGTLVASYSRGMRVMSESGGIRCTVLNESMQRAPLFEFDNARDARDFCQWMDENMAAIREQAESTSSVAKLIDIQRWPVSRMIYTRFNFTTGDAAGQNMTSKAARHACLWMLDNYPGKVKNFALSSGIETDKKHSYMNLLHSRGKRVIAEAVVKRDVLEQRMRVTPEAVFKMRQRSMLGAALAGSAYNGPHSANGIAALFIATGQDEANVVESHTGLSFLDVTEDGDLYCSVTLPSVICATHGGGTGLPHQQECLKLLGCEGKGKARKLAEIIGATVLAGDLSLAAAIVADEWVSSHDAYGRNR